jgi:hypothetical protein
VLQTKNVNQGQTAVYSGSTPVRPGNNEFSFTFTGWDRNLTNVTSSFTTQAQFTSTTNTYTVTWKNHDGTTLETDTNVPYRTTPTYNGATPVREGEGQFSYTFTGWSPSVTSVTSNVTYTAQFFEFIESFTVTWQNHNGTVLEIDTNVSRGATPTYNGATPIKDGDTQYAYVFIGWSPLITSVTTNVTYTAQFGESTKTYTVIWQNHDGTVLETDNNVPYGSTPTFNQSNPIRPSSDGYDYAFTGWLPAVTPVSGNITYVAQFNETANFIPITTAQELSNIRNNLTATYRLMNDIDLESAEWQPIGTASTPFSGTFIGNQFTISNLTITQTQTYVGLFANNSGTIKNLKLGNVQINVTGSISSFIYAGSLVANNTGTIENIETISGSLFIRARGGNNGHVGGIIGFHNRETTLDKLTNAVIITGQSGTSTAGLIGISNSTITITNSLNSGSVSGTSNVGGLIGISNSTITITNSLNSGSVSGTSNQVGGLIGISNSTTTITNSLNSGSVSGTSNQVGGLIGYGSTTTITNSLNSGSVSGNYYVGGLIGYGSTTTITNSLNSGSVSGNYSVGGLIGISYSTITITNSLNSGSVSSTSSQVGGLIGYGSTITITNSLNSGSVSSTSFRVGGLIGSGSTTTITNSLNSGSVSSTSSQVGGLIGYGYNTTITNSLNNGSVSSTSSQLGGLIGYGENQLFVYYSVNFGDVVVTNSTTEIGGIAGRIPATNDVEEAYHFGSITSNSVEVAGTNYGTKVTDISTFNLAFFTTTLGWSSEVWDFTGLDIANGVYPKLKNMPTIEE